METEKGWPQARVALSVAVVALRLIIGAVFVVSGFAKAIDPWGTFYKVSEYLEIWGWGVPRTLAVTGSIALGVTELALGALLMLGCWRRAATWLLLAMMCLMLPLSAWIYATDPVADCGCFGDMLVLSNSATFWKNVVLTAALVFLAVFNTRVRPWLAPPAQWGVAALLVLYGLAVSLYGYNVQPLLDFRRWPVGAQLVEPDGDEEETAVEYEFVYGAPDGTRHTFTQDSLPDDTYTFIERRLVSGSESQREGFAVADADGEDITTEAIDTAGRQVLILVPDPVRMDLAHTYTVNRLAEKLQPQGITVAALVAGGQSAVGRYQDLSMAQYPVYAVEPNLIKELARGNPAIVYLDGGAVRYKSTLTAARSPWRKTPVEDHTGSPLIALTSILVAAICVIYAFSLFLTHLRKTRQK